MLTGKTAAPDLIHFGTLADTEDIFCDQRMDIKVAQIFHIIFTKTIYIDPGCFTGGFIGKQEATLLYLAGFWKVLL